MDILIRHTEPRDSIALQELHGQRESMMGTLQTPYPSEEFWKNRLEALPDRSTTLVAEIEGKVVGHAGLICWAKSPRRMHVGEIGMAVHRDWTRKGVGTALMEALVDLSEQWLNLARIELTVFVDNEPAIALYKKFGFEIEGTHKKYAFRAGKFVDSYSMARVR